MTLPRSLRSLRKGSPIAGFTLVELMVSAVVMAIMTGGIIALTSQCFSLIKSSREDSAAALALEYRLEQFSRATWTDATCEEPPPDAYTPPTDTEDSDYTETVDDVYGSDYTDDLGDSDMTPGVVDLLATTSDSLGTLPNVDELIRIVPFPNTGNTQIVATRASDGTIAYGSSSADYGDLAFENSVQVTVRIRWQSGGRTRSLVAVTIVSRADK